MNTENINKKLLDEIKLKLPPDANVASCLMDILFIGKEAIYRRIRGEVPFTFHEAAIISGKWGISLDKIAENKVNTNALFELKPVSFYDWQELDYQMLEESIETFKIINKSPYSEFVYSSNIFPMYPSILYPSILKFHSFKWVYLNKEKDSIIPFREIKLTDRFTKLTRETILGMMDANSTCYIWNTRITQDIVSDIKYFSNINLISKEEIVTLKQDLYKLMDELEIIAIKGEFSNGHKVYIYITNTNFDTTYSYFCTDSIFISMIGAFSFNNVVALDKEALERVKVRIQSLKKVSTLISESGEIERIDFFAKQRRILDTL